MSFSPPIRRLSTSSKREEDLINAYEAEEERIINILSRKLEQLREEKIALENVLEAESESHVNRLTRELSVLRLAQHANGNSSSEGSGTQSPEQPLAVPPSILPTSAQMLDAMRRENEELRHRLVDMERDYIRTVRTNEIYREELIEHRTRLGHSLDDLIGIPSSQHPPSQPSRRRGSIPAPGPSGPPVNGRSTNGIPIAPASAMPIPRPSSRIHRPAQPSLDSVIPSLESPSYSPSISPLLHTHPSGPSGGAISSYGAAFTNITTPASSASLHSAPPTPPASAHVAPRILSYPHVPPPSLSSSFAGSPTTSYFVPTSPAEVRRGQGGRPGQTHRTASSRSASRGRVAETGSLISRRQSLSRTDGLPSAAGILAGPEGTSQPSLAFSMSP